jgi:hypothetical protein
MGRKKLVGDKIRNTASLTVSLPKELDARMRKAAVKGDMTLSRAAVRAFKMWLGSL